MIREEMQILHAYLLQGGTPGTILKTKNAGEAISGHFAKRLKSQIYLNYAYLQLFQRRRSPFIYFFFLLNVFEHKIEVIMSWQICREVLNAYVDPAFQIATTFLRTSFEI